jgi:tRNA modification GTPase
MAVRIERELLEPISRLIKGHIQHKIYTEGVKTVIVGRVNVGKSSLLNRLSNEQKAIVTAVPGTTRDIVESNLNLDGLPLHLMDTAGFRETRGEVEEIGLELTRRKLAECDLALVVLDQSRPFSEEDIEIIERSPKDRSLLVVNKIDLPAGTDPEAWIKYNQTAPAVRTSALTGQGLDDLRRAIRNLVLSSEAEMSSNHLAPNLRHKESLDRVRQNLESAVENIRAGFPLDIIAVDLEEGLTELGSITGQSADDEVIQHIFSQFCLGK